MSVLTRKTLAVSGLALALAALVAAGTQAPVRNGAPTQEELRALIERVVASQHHNDEALAEYERHERRIERKHDGTEGRIVEDKTFRVVPTGTGTVKMLVVENGQSVAPAVYRKQLAEIEKVLDIAANRPDLPRQKEAVAKGERRKRERADLVDSVPEAFQVTWLGREQKNGRTLVKLQFDLDPNFKPRVKNAGLFAHVQAILWVEEAEAQVVRMEARIAKDISVFGGIAGKVYKGGTFVMEQTKVAEGVWLPSRYEYDFDGRKFVFPFSVNETTEASNYRRIGPPQEALAVVRRELQGGGSSTARPASGNSVQ